MQDNYHLFHVQLFEVLERYPNLVIKQGKEGGVFLQGILDVPDDSGLVVDNFLIEVHPTAGFPFRFPKLFETGGRIPNEIDWHKYSDGSCCITVLPDEILKCKYGITIISFIEKYAVSFFANYLYRKKEGYYLNGEYAHGHQGTEQFYTEILKTNNKELWIEYFKYVFMNAKIPCKRHSLCFCGTGRKFKHCHDKIFDELRMIGKEQVLEDYKILLQ